MNKLKYRVWNNQENRYDNTVMFDIDGNLYKTNSCRDSAICLPNNKNKFILEIGSKLKDKNDNIVFEGDILKESEQMEYGIVEFIYAVYFDEDYNYLCLREIKTGIDKFGVGVVGNFEIIGNVHNNPELLEVK